MQRKRREDWSSFKRLWMPKKIFFIANAASIHTAKWVNFFVEKDYEVHLATFSTENQTKCENIYFLGKKGMRRSGGNYHYLFSIPKLVKLFKEIRPEHVNAHYSYSMGLVTLLAKQWAKTEAKFSVVCHGSDVLSPPSPFVMDRINRYVLRRADRVFAVSDEIKEKLLSLGIASEKIWVGQYGIELEKKKIEKDIDILSNRVFTTHSGIRFLLEALTELNEKKLQIVFVLPYIEAKQFQSLVEQYPFITFYKAIGHDTMLDMVGRSKIYISATQSDGSALSLLEAMSLGAVPLVSNIPSNRSWIVDGLNGYLFDTRASFLGKLKKILNMSQSESDVMRVLNRRLIEYRADYQTQMHKIEMEVL